MRTLGFLGLMALTLYLAGMFHVPALMTAFVAEAVLLILQLLVTLYFSLRIRVRFAKETDIAYDNAVYRLRLLLDNRAGIPAGRIGIRLQLSYAQENRSRSYTLHLPCPAGTSEALLHLTFACCGRADVRIRRVHFHDYLSFFVLPRRVRDAASRIYVLPKTLITGEEMLSDPDPRLDEEVETSHGSGDGSEVLQVRPYREGDPIRHLHRNLTARLEEPMIREFPESAHRPVLVLIRVTATDRADVSRMHHMYHTLGELLSTERARTVSVFWYDGKKRELCDRTVRDSLSRQDLFLSLYELDAVCADGNADAENRLLTEKTAGGESLYVLSASGIREAEALPVRV